VEEKRDVDRMMNERDIDGLIAALQDADEFARSDAALALGAIGDQKALGPLDRMRSSDPSASAREAAEIAYRWVVGRMEEVQKASR